MLLRIRPICRLREYCGRGPKGAEGKWSGFVGGGGVRNSWCDADFE